MSEDTFTEDDRARAERMPDAEFRLFVRAQRLYRANPGVTIDDPAMEQIFDALAGAGLVIPSVRSDGFKEFEIGERHTQSFLAALTARAEREGLLA